MTRIIGLVDVPLLAVSRGTDQTVQLPDAATSLEVVGRDSLGITS